MRKHCSTKRCLLPNRIFLPAGFILLLGLISVQVAATPSPEAVRAEAYQNLKIANELIVQAAQIMRGNPSQDQLRMAVNLYARAGQLFEKSGNDLMALGQEYANAEDVEGARRAMQNCINSIQQIKQRLG